MFAHLHAPLFGLLALLLLSTTTVVAQRSDLPLCTYLTQAEAAVLGNAPVGSGVSVDGSTGLCGYQYVDLSIDDDTHITPTVQLSVTDSSGVLTASELFDVQAFGKPNSAVQSLGQRAFWTSNGVVTELVVLQGDYLISVRVTNPDAMPSAEEMAPFAVRVLAAL